MRASALADYARGLGQLGRPFIYLHETGSTNDEVRERALAGAREGLLVLAEVQHAGRGRLGRRWESPAGTSLLFSLLFHPPEPVAPSAARIQMLCELALLEAVREQLPSAFKIKWPNDLIVSDGEGWRKVAGMLGELESEGGRPTFLILGIGLNVNIPSEALPVLAPNATSLAVEGGRPVERALLLDDFLSRADGFYARFKAGWDPLPDWRAELAWMGERVEVRTPGRTWLGRAEDVDAEGALLLRTTEGILQRFTAGDVTLRPL